MSQQGGEEEMEDRPVSIASLRSKFEGLAAGSATAGVIPRPRTNVAASIKPDQVSVKVLEKQIPARSGDEAALTSGQKEILNGATERPAINNVALEERADGIASTEEVKTVESIPKPRLKPPIVAPKPPSLVSRPSSPAPQTSSSQTKTSRAGDSDTRTPSVAQGEMSTIGQADPSFNHVSASSVNEDETSLSVKDRLARFNQKQTGIAANAIAGPSQPTAIRRKPPPPRPLTPDNSTTPSSPIARPPSIRRTSAKGTHTIRIPLSPPSDQIETGPAVPTLSNASSRPASPLPRSTTPTSISDVRSASPKPPEPDRASKPTRTPQTSAPSSPPNSSPLLASSADGAASPQSKNSMPALPVRKTSESIPSSPTTGPPPIPPNRPRLATVATAVIAAQTLAAPPRLPARNRGESVGTRDIPPPPSRLPPIPQPTKSATVIPSLPARRDRGPTISSKTSTLESPTEEYQPPLPPTRNIIPSSALPAPPTRTLRPAETLIDLDSEEDDEQPDAPAQPHGLTNAARRALEDTPDSTHANRRPPRFTPDMKVTGTAHTTCFAMHGRYVCTGSHVVRVYDTQLSDQPIHYVDLHSTGLEFRIKDPKVTAMCFRPAAFKSEEGRYLWCGTKDGHLWELDIKTGEITDTRPSSHSSPVVHIFRYKKTIMTLEENGKLLVFTVGQQQDTEDGFEEDNISHIPQLTRSIRISERFNFAKLLGGRLWTSSGPSSRSTTTAAAAKGPTIRLYDPCLTGGANSGKTVWATEWTGAVTCATFLPLHPEVVYLGHEGGYVSVWDAEEVLCRQVLKISSSDILSLEGVGERLWAGNRKGQIHAYDVTTRPWRTTNLWTAHPEHSVHQLAVDPWSIEQTGRFMLWSLGKDSLRAWDGLLSVDWIAKYSDSRMTARQADYSHFRSINTLVCSWNIDSARPTDLMGSEANTNLLPDLLHSVESPEIIVFGFQEVIPLTDKKLTAKTLLFGSKNKESNSTADKVSHAYRQWLEKLSMAVRSAYPDTPYIKVHSESLVGLLTCVFVKASERDYLRDVDVCTVKRGIGGIYGNKGAIIARLVIDDTSLCFINVHLAAGQSAKAARTVDLGVIMEDKAILPVTDRLPFVNGGDGAAVLDHELVILNGDLNYRIDQRRENVLSSIQAGELQYLLEHDQLRKEMQSNHAFRLRSFEEAPIHFKPTYKYNTGTSDYDSSEKRRIPAWCDRILFNKTPRLQSTHYRRYETTVSDHKPISAGFRMQVKAVDEIRMEEVRREVGKEWAEREMDMLGKMEIAYLDMV